MHKFSYTVEDYLRNDKVKNYNFLVTENWLMHGKIYSVKVQDNNG